MIVSSFQLEQIKSGTKQGNKASHNGELVDSWVNTWVHVTHNGELVDSWVRVTQIYLTRDLITCILGCKTIGLVIDLKKGFIAPNKRWDPLHAMSRFSPQYQPFSPPGKRRWLLAFSTLAIALLCENSKKIYVCYEFLLF